MMVADQRGRYKDLFSLPDNVVDETIAGQLYTHSRPEPAHAGVSSVLGNKVGTHFDHGEGGGPGGWWILGEPELHLSEDILVPNLADWRRERMPYSPKPLGSRWSPTASAKYYPRPPPVPTVYSNWPVMPPPVPPIAGSSTPMPAPWKLMPIRMAARSSSVHGEAMTSPASIPSPPSPFPSTAHGWIEHHASQLRANHPNSPAGCGKLRPGNRQPMWPWHD